MKILVIEDDDKTAGFVLKALKESGYSTIHAKDGNEGYRFATLHSIDLAIIDLMLPGINGLTVIENIRKHNIEISGNVYTVDAAYNEIITLSFSIKNNYIL